MRRGIVAIVAAFALTGCAGGGGDEPSENSASETSEPDSSPSQKAEPSSKPTETSEEAKEAAYLKKVRADIPGAVAYDDGLLLNMASNVCSLGSVDLGVEVLDNYSQIEAEDRQELATIALKTAC